MMGFRWHGFGRPWLLAMALVVALLVACGSEEADSESTPTPGQADGTAASPSRPPPPLTVSSISPNPASVGGEVVITFETDPGSVIGLQIDDAERNIVSQGMLVADSEGTASHTQRLTGVAGTWVVQAAAGRSSRDLLNLRDAQSSPGANESPRVGRVGIEGNYETQAASGETGTRTATASDYADEGNAHILALRPASAPSAISFRAAASAGALHGSLSLTIDRPSGTVAGDVMIASVAVRPYTADMTAPDGWTLLRRMDEEGNRNANSLAVYYKVAGGSEPSDYTWTFSIPTGAAGGIQTFTGVDTANPIDVEDGQITPDGLSHTTPSVTTTVAGTMLVTAHAYASGAPWTPPSGMTEGFQAASESVPTPGTAWATFEVQ